MLNIWVNSPLISITLLGAVALLSCSSNMALGYVVFIALASIICPLGGDFIAVYMDYIAQIIVILSLLVMFWFILTSCDVSFTYVCGVLVYLLSILSFTVDSIFWLFVWFESSLLPMVAIIVLTGVQFERIGASIYILMYTVSLGSVFILGLFSMSTEMVVQSISLGYYVSDFSMSGLMILVLIVFIVNVPVFLLHSWLPKAHLESGLSGSILLAGILLKVGLYGSLRVLSVSIIPSCIKIWLLGVSAVGICVSGWLSLSSNDIKITVAYSSVSHMNLSFSVCLTGGADCPPGVLLGGFCHSLVSVMLFCYVSCAYYVSGSRSYCINNGMIGTDSMFGLAAFSLWCLNMSLPPSLAFLAEVYQIESIISYSYIFLLLIMLFIFVNSCVCVLNCVISNNSVNNSYFNGEISYWYVSTILVFSLLVYSIFLVSEVIF